MFESISRGWALTKTSFKVLKLDKEILALPIISGLLLILVAVVFFVPIATIQLALGGTANGPAASVWVLIFLFYVAAYFVILWFNAATIEMATIRFNGGDPVLKDGLRKAWSKSGRILQWAIVAATVGLLLKILDNMARQSRNDATRIIGEIAVSLAGAAWNIATFFVMPILIYQDLGPFQAIKTSVGTWKRTWGEGFTATFSTGIIFFLLWLPAILVVFFALSVGGVGGIVLFAVAVVYSVLIWAAQTAVDGIIVAALYKYAVDGHLPEAFGNVQMPAPRPTYG
ncbi:MAG: DUF6159 family protein [Thermoplasmatota archaeon]